MKALSMIFVMFFCISLSAAQTICQSTESKNDWIPEPTKDMDMKPHPKYRNIIFDLGNVLVFSNLKYALHDFCTLAGGSAEHSSQAKSIHLEYDRGALTEEQFAEQLVHALFPGKEAAMYEATLQLVQDNIKGLTLLEPGLSLLQSVQSKGYKIYILSNLTLTAHDALNKFPGFLEQFDGAIFSYKIKHVKPEPEIYQTLLTTYALNPEECLFIDDLEVNIEGGKMHGIDGIVYREPVQSLEELKELGVI